MQEVLISRLGMDGELHWYRTMEDAIKEVNEIDPEACHGS